MMPIHMHGYVLSRVSASMRIERLQSPLKSVILDSTIGNNALGFSVRAKRVDRKFFIDYSAADE
jgi:hypothetical protein